MMPKVATSANGMVMLGVSVAHGLRRNAKMISTTRNIVNISVNSTSETDARIESERSLTRSTWTDGGIDLSRLGSSP